MNPERPTRWFTVRRALLALVLVLIVAWLFDSFLLPALRGERTLRGHTSSVNCLAFASDGARLFSGGRDGKVIAWDLKTFEPEIILDLVPHSVDALAVSPDGSLLAIASDFDTTVGDKWMERDPTPDGIRALVVDLRTGKRVAELRSPLDEVLGLAFAPGRPELYVADHSGRLSAWDTQKWTLKRQGPDNEGLIEAFAMSPDGRMLAIQTLAKVLLFDSNLQSIGRDLVKGQRKGYGLAFAPDGKTVAFPSGGNVVLADPRAGSVARSLPAPDRVRAVAYSPDGRLVASGSMAWGFLLRRSGHVTVWWMGSGEEVLSRKRSAGVTALAFSPDGGYLAVADVSGSILLLSTQGW